MAQLLAITIIVPDEPTVPVTVRVVTACSSTERQVSVATLDLGYSVPEELTQRITDQIGDVCGRQ